MRIIKALLIPALFFLAPFFVSAGTIDTVNKYARFLGDGTLINFGATNGNVVVNNSNITGYAWAGNAGWINMAPANGGVLNNGSGVLSGYAWGEHTGWVNFRPTNGGVNIDSSGNFTGYAWSEAKGWIVFNCATDNTCGTLSHRVQTNWAPASTPPPSSGGGGGGFPYVPPTPPSQPTLTPGVETPPHSDPSNIVSELSVLQHDQNTVPPDQPIQSQNNELQPNSDFQDDTESVSRNSSVVATESSSISSITDAIGGTFGTFATYTADVLSGAIKNISDISSNSVVVLKENAKEVVLQTKFAVTTGRREIKEALSTPVGEVTSTTAVTAGVVVGGATAVAPMFFAQLFTLKDLFLLPAQLWGLLLLAFGIKRRHRPWGAVYDSVTRQPLDPAYVELLSLDGKEVATAFTDLDGRYGFFAPPGTYKIVANKSNYKFPSKRLSGKTEDEFYGNLYFGESIVLNDEGVFLARDIPMDPEGFDWNEYAKRSKKLMGFYSRNTIFIERASFVFFTAGGIVTLFVLFADPTLFNFVIALLYVFLWLIRKVGTGDRPHGVLIDKKTGEPISFGVVRVMTEDGKGEVRKCITDALGRYYCLVAKGSYNVQVLRKENDGTYSKTDFEEKVEAPRGIIRKKIEA